MLTGGHYFSFASVCFFNFKKIKSVWDRGIQETALTDTLFINLSIHVSGHLMFADGF